MSERSVAWGWALAALMALPACGGGGGGVAEVPATIPLSGKVSFDQVPNPNGGLAYEASTSQPVRGAAVDVIDSASATVVASTTTDELGAYATLAPPDRMVSVRVRAQASHNGPDGSWDVSIRDNTRDGAVYAMESPAFTVQRAALTRDLHAGSGWGGASYTGPRVAAPFAILDAIHRAMAKVRTVAPTAVFPPLRVFWSTANVPAVGRVALGQIGTSSYAVDAIGAVDLPPGQGRRRHR